MSKATIKTATASDEVSVIDVILQAFRADPVARWALPDQRQYETYFPTFIRAFAGGAFKHMNAYYVDGYSGAALWLPPGVHPDQETISSLFERILSPEIREQVFSVFEQMGSYHPSEPHWYLPMIGVVPGQQGKGYGSALMKHALEICDRDKRPAYLESTNQRNLPLYERFGFELLGTIESGTSPTLYPMIREPKPVPRNESSTPPIAS